MGNSRFKRRCFAASFALATLFASQALAVNIRVTVENLSPATGFGLSPVVAVAHDGSVDLFDNGSIASTGVEDVAELGNFTALLGEIAGMQSSAAAAPVANSMGVVMPLFPSAVQSVVLSLDPADNRYFSFLSMVVPSNDAFIGNDDPTSIELFDAGGSFVANDFNVSGAGIWDAGTEVNGLTGALFVVGQDGSLSPAEGGVVHPADLDTIFDFYVGEDTPAGYEFSGGPSANDPVASISFELVPEPASFALLSGLAICVGSAARLRRRFT